MKWILALAGVAASIAVVAILANRPPSDRPIPPVSEPNPTVGNESARGADPGDAAGEGAAGGAESGPDSAGSPSTAAREPERTAPPDADFAVRVLTRVQTKGSRIAITVDDCQQIENIRRIMDLCDEYSVKVTFFPIAQSIRKEPAVWAEALDRGFQIENHTVSHDVRLRDAEEGKLRWEIEGLNKILNMAIGAEYEMRFVRTPGGNGDGDENVHRILKELGYRFVAHWSLSATGSSAEQLAKSLRVGEIVLFHAKDEDVAKLEILIPRAIAMGFEPVTLNGLLGFEPNPYRKPEP